MERSTYRKRVSAVVEIVPGEPGLPISFFPGNVALRDLPALANIGEEFKSGDPEAVVKIADFLELIGLQWELTDGGVPVPCTKEQMLGEDGMLMLAIFIEVQKHVSPKSLAPKSEDSDASSSTETASPI